ncbi:hypothetical protein J7K42_01995 [bacterium]|nr:hypothetical protein [bacterium]
MAKPFKEDSLIKKILVYLGETSVGLLSLGATIAIDPHRFLRGEGPFGSYSKPRLSKDISYLKRSKYFKYKNDKLYLTQKGREKIIKLIIKKRNKGKVKKWDGKWRGIIFDIPELDRRDRNFLRKELYQMGFRELQKSVWVAPFDFERELKTLLKLWKRDFGGDIRFLVIEKIDNDSDLKQHFNLKSTFNR